MAFTPAPANSPPWSSAQFRTFRKRLTWFKPTASNAFVYIEEHPDSINDACFGMDMPNYLD